MGKVTFREAGAALLVAGNGNRSADLLAIMTAESGRDTHAVYVIEGPFRGHYDGIGNEVRSALQQGARVMVGCLQYNSRNYGNNLDKMLSLLDLLTSAQEARGYNLAAWSTYGGVRYGIVHPAAVRMIRKLQSLSHQELTDIVHGAGALPGEGIPHSVGKAAKAATAPIAAIAGFLGALFRGSTWIRVGEVGAGLVLIFIGITFAARDLGLGPVERFGRRQLGRLRVAKALPGGAVRSLWKRGKRYA